MRRPILLLISLFSLLLCLATAAATAASFFRGISVYCARTWVITDLGWGDEVTFRVDRGTLVLHASRVIPADSAELARARPFREFYCWPSQPLLAEPAPKFHFRYASTKSSNSVDRRLDISVPGICVGLAFLALPCAWYRSRRKLHERDHCRSCGYNLTGNTSGTCPECSTPVPSSADTRSTSPEWTNQRGRE